MGRLSRARTPERVARGPARTKASLRERRWTPAFAGVTGLGLAEGKYMREPKRGYVYIMTNGVSGTLYIGVTAYLLHRIDQHRRGVGSDFCRKYRCTRLVHVEVFESIVDAIAREKAMKAWRRSWKLNLVSRANPGWRDLWDEYARP